MQAHRPTSIQQVKLLVLSNNEALNNTHASLGIIFGKNNLYKTVLNYKIL